MVQPACSAHAGGRGRGEIHAELQPLVMDVGAEVPDAGLAAEGSRGDQATGSAAVVRQPRIIRVDERVASLAKAQADKQVGRLAQDLS